MIIYILSFIYYTIATDVKQFFELLIPNLSLLVENNPSFRNMDLSFEFNEESCKSGDVILITPINLQKFILCPHNFPSSVLTKFPEIASDICYVTETPSHPRMLEDQDASFAKTLSFVLSRSMLAAQHINLKSVLRNYFFLFLMRQI